MTKLLYLVACMLLSGPLAAEIYKWVDEEGVTHYGEHPPANASAIYVDVRPNIIDGVKKQDCRDCQTEKLDPYIPAPAQRLAGTAPSIHGLAFEIFIKIERGMTEGEVLVLTGMPDQEVFEGTEERSVAIVSSAKSTNAQNGQPVRNTLVQSNTVNLAVKTYYYLPTVSDPFTTIITFKGGRVTDIQRIRKL